ncbi:acyl-CoA carboxylase subunit beta [Novosphingobium sp. ERN07]|uniref:acyl-CoA carboxylase subunit beta n=1 Tax=Novosphingobium sp. ERN07 TaxID=2726187 RepID=UPI0014571BFA|nr:carboxyl transferase domain-containing protein [Novosphingobium sp. ERN07]
MSPAVAELLARRETARRDMGGAAKVAAIHKSGGLTARDWIDRLVDLGSFREIGTFVQPIRHEQRNGAYSDGKIGGHAAVDGRPVSVGADDLTVKAGTDAHSNKRRSDKIFRQAMERGNPIVYFGQAAGSRIPDILGSETMSRGSGLGAWLHRRRQIPAVMAIVGRSYGESSFNSALSDFVVQLRGATLAVTSTRVIEMATAERITEEELGGVDIHNDRTGQIDLAVDTPDQMIEAVQSFLSYLPTNSRELPPRREAQMPVPVPDLRTLVPAERRRGYDMRKVLRAIVDDGDYLELKPRFGRSALTVLARINGRPVGIVASQPMFQGGAMTPEACDKITRFVCTADSFNVPLVFLADTPGFLVGTQVEQNKLLHKAVLLNQALFNVKVPRLTFVLRKAYGLAYFAMSGGSENSALLCGWPTAEISFMDPEVAANVVYGPELAALEDEARTTRAAELAAELKRGTSAYEAAAVMGLDEIIDPAETPVVIAEWLERLMANYDPINRPRVLSTWPTCF